MAEGVAIFAEWAEEGLHPVSLELLSEARLLADELEDKVQAYFLAPPDKETQAEILIRHGADEVFYVFHQCFEDFLDDVASHILAKMIRENSPEILLFPATARGQALAPRVAGYLRLGLTAHCIAFEIRKEDRTLVQIRPSFGENVMARIISLTKPQMATVRPGVFSKAKEDPTRTGRIKKISLSDEEVKSALHIFKKHPRKAPKVDLAQARVVIAGGRGMGTKEFFAKLYELAELLEGAVGATRPVCHLGWISEEHMIGVSGHTISPKLYLGFGISGAIHHLVGIRNPGLIVAVNKDPEAPLMKKADVAVVGDVREILPLLIRRLKELKGESHEA